MVQPDILKRNDTIAIVAPAGRLIDGTLSSALNIFAYWGLQVKIGEHLEKGDNYFSATDDERLSDFQKAIDDPEIKAIFCARGGYGTTRIIDNLNFESVEKHPKWIVGFSDITVLHLHLHTMGIETIHSVMPTGFGTTSEKSIESLRKVLFGERVHYEIMTSEMNRIGETKAPIIGGNLSLILDSLGTSSEIEFHNKILFIEEIDEYLYKIDRMIVQLKRAGILANLAGMIIGHMTDIKDTKVPFGKTANKLIFGHVAEYSYPVTFNFPIGHEVLNLAIPCSRECQLTIDTNSVVLDFA